MARGTLELDDDGPLYDEHPLFPLVDNEKPYEISYITITRHENGVQKWGPSLPAEQLMTEEAIFELYGGGNYTLIARAATKRTGLPGKNQKARRINLAGKMKPLSGNPTPEELKFYEGLSTTVEAKPAGQSFGDMGQLFALMLQMNQQSAQRAQEQAQQFMTMFMGMMQGSKGDAQRMTEMMMTMSSQNQQTMMQFVTAMMANRGGGPEEMAKYADLLKTLGFAKGEAKEGDKSGNESVGAIIENAADIVTGLVQLKGVMVPPNGQNGVAQPVVAEAPPGSALSFVRGLGR